MVRSYFRSARSDILRPHLAAAALLALLAGRAAHADSTWTNASGGNWGVPGNWNNNNVPDSPGESAIILPPGPYTVFLDTNYSINALTISHVLARVDLQNSLNLTLSGGLDGAGVLTVNNAAGPNQTYIRVNTSQSWIGTGKVVLNAAAGNLDTAYIYFNGGGEVLTLASGKEIVGSGRVYVSMVNNGGVIADTFGRILDLTSQVKTNNNEFAAVNGGILSLSSVSVPQGSSGIIRSLTGSTVSIAGSSISGGKIQTDAGGLTQFSGTSTITGVSTSGALDVVNAATLQMVNSLVNDGDIRINDGSGANNSNLRVQNSSSLDGVGTITLRSNGANLDTAYIYPNGGGEVLTQGAQHTIRGSGNIYVGMVNNGTISATTPGRTLRLTSVSKTNNKNILADTGRLEIDSTTISQGPAGVISLSANVGASLNYSTCTINSGLVQSSGNSSTASGTTNFNNTTISGPFTLLNASEMRLGGAGTSHTGDLFVNTGGANNSLIRVVQNHTISGNGRIVLRSNGSNLDTAYLMYNGGGETLTQAAGHSIVGTGNIYVALDNAGLVSADQAGKALGLTGFGKSNSGVMRAIGGGVLLSTSTTITQTGAGVLRSDASLFQTAATVVNGGLIESINGGVCEFTGNSTFNNVTLAGVGRVPNGNELRIGGGSLINTGTLTVNPTGGVNGTFIRVMQNQSLSGLGSIVLNAHASNLDTAYVHYNGGGELLTQATSHSIRGTGRIYVGLANNGLVSANAAGKVLELTGFQKSNTNVFEAASGGILRFSSVTVVQSPLGLTRSTSGGLLSFVASSISNGTIQTASSALSDAASFSANSIISGVTLQGAAKVPNGNELRLSGSGMTNNGVLTINDTAGSNGTFLRVTASAPILGTGSIVLNANPANLDTGYILYNGGGEILSLGSGQTLAGTGRSYVRTINDGVVAPGGTPDGNPIGVIDLAGFRFSNTSDAIMAFEISGPAPSQFDRITGSATMDLAGSLVPSLINSYDPPIGTAYDIINGPAIVGTFASVGPGFTVQYFPNKVRVIYTGPSCPADLNHDDVVDDADFVIFVPAYNLLDCADPSMPAGCPADMNRDGVVDDADFVIFLAQYNELICPE